MEVETRTNDVKCDGYKYTSSGWIGGEFREDDCDKADEHLK